MKDLTWRHTTLGEVITLQRGVDLPQCRRVAGSTPVVGANGVVGHHNEAVAAGPGVLVGRSGSAGKVTWIPTDYWPLNTALWVKDFQGNDPHFIFYFLTHLRLERFAQGVSVPTLNRNLVHPCEVWVPTQLEQRTIAGVLRAVQDAREARRRELDVERERCSSLAEQLVTQGTRGEPCRPTNIGLIPERWEVRRLGDIAQVSYGLTVNQSRRQSQNLAPYLTVANVTRGHLRLAAVKEIGISNGDAERFRLLKGDVLLVEGNGNPRLLGSAAVWNDELPFALHQNHLIRARLNQSVATPTWVMALINSDVGRTQLLGTSKTSSGLHTINSRIVSNLQVPVPPLDEQREIVDVLTACDVKIAALESEASLLDELFRALLDELMTGRLSALPLLDT